MLFFNLIICYLHIKATKLLKDKVHKCGIYGDKRALRVPFLHQPLMLNIEAAGFTIVIY